MIEPLRYRPVEQQLQFDCIDSPVLCWKCQRERVSTQAFFLCHACGKTDKAVRPFCEQCFFDYHVTEKRGKADHKPHPIMRGESVTVETLADGDRATYAKLHDWVTLDYVLKTADSDDIVEDTFASKHPLVFQSGCSGPCVHLQLIGCSNIAAADIIGSSDPYCAIYWKDEFAGATTTKHMTLNPRWANQSFVLPLADDFVAALDDAHASPLFDADALLPKLRVEIYDWDRLSKNDFLGQASVCDADLLRILRRARSGEAQEDDVISFKLMPRSSRGKLGIRAALRGPKLFVHIVQAENVPKADPYSLSDPYCDVYWNEKRVGKTSHIDDTLDPVWDLEIFVIKIDAEGPNSLEESVLRVECLDWDQFGSDDVLGQIELNGRQIRELAESSGVGNDVTWEGNGSLPESDMDCIYSFIHNFQKQEGSAGTMIVGVPQDPTIWPPTDEAMTPASTPVTELHGTVQKKSGIKRRRRAGRTSPILDVQTDKDYAEGTGEERTDSDQYATAKVPSDAPSEYVVERNRDHSVGRGSTKWEQDGVATLGIGVAKAAKDKSQGREQDADTGQEAMSVVASDCEQPGMIVNTRSGAAGGSAERNPLLDTELECMARTSASESRGSLDMCDAKQADSGEQGREPPRTEGARAAPLPESGAREGRGAVGASPQYSTAEEDEGRDLDSRRLFKQRQRATDVEMGKEQVQLEATLSLEGNSNLNHDKADDSAKFRFRDARVQRFEEDRGVLVEYIDDGSTAWIATKYIPRLEARDSVPAGDSFFRRAWDQFDKLSRLQKRVLNVKRGLRVLLAIAMTGTRMQWFQLELTEEHSGAKFVRGTVDLRFLHHTRGSVLRGLDVAVSRMSLGERARIRVRPDYGFGEVYATRKVPPYTTLIFVAQIAAIGTRDAKCVLLRRALKKAVDIAISRLRACVEGLGYFRSNAKCQLARFRSLRSRLKGVRGVANETCVRTSARGRDDEGFVAEGTSDASDSDQRTLTRDRGENTEFPSTPALGEVSSSPHATLALV